MKQVYLTSRSNGLVETATIFSSKWRAIAYFNRILDKPKFEWEGDTCGISVDGSTVGWITKKMVQ